MTKQKNTNLSLAPVGGPESFGLKKQNQFLKGEKKEPLPVFFNACFDKNHLKTLIAWFLDTYGEKQTVDLVENLKQVGFHQATQAGVSLGLDDLQIPPQKAMLLSQASRKMGTVTTVKMTGTLTTVEKSQQLIDTWNQTSETLREEAIQNFRLTNPVNPVYMMAFSGARGNISQVRQLVAMRGLMADPQGAIVEFPIQSNFREGLTVTEYLISCYGARKGLVDTALRTATSGYLTRRLVDAVQHVVIRLPDCQTRQGILIKETNIEQRLIGRVLLQDLELTPNFTLEKNTLISPRLAKKIAFKYSKVFVRSPLTCQTEKSVCQLCYGLDLAQGKLVNIGEAVGIIAGQSIGEPGTQLTMRTFHTGGVGVFSEQSVKSFTAPFPGKVEFPEALPGVFVRTPHGKIAYLIKHQSDNPQKPVLRVVSTESSSCYEIYQKDVPAGSLLWVKQGEKVETGTLLIQALNLETKQQAMPELSHSVLSPFSGEVFFEFMRIRETELKKRKKSASKKQEEVVPVIPTLINLGNFWIMSSFIQKEKSRGPKLGFLERYWSSILKKKPKEFLSFFEKGDLVSSQTPIHQVKIYVSSKCQLKKVASSLILGSSATKFRFSRIQYCQGTYFFQPIQKQNDIVVSTPKSNQMLLTWYPSNLTRQKNIKNTVGYIQPVSGFLFQKNSVLFPKNNVFEKGDKEANVYLWSSYPVFEFVKPTQNQSLLNQSKSPSFDKFQSFFLVADGMFSKSGVFQTQKCQPNKPIHRTKISKYQSFRSFSRSNLLNFKSFRNNPLSLPQNQVISQTSVIPKTQLILKTSFLEQENGKGIKPVLSEKHSLQKNENLIKKYQKIREKLLISFSNKLIQKEKIWFYVAAGRVSTPSKVSCQNLFLEPGKRFENLSFPNSHVSFSGFDSTKVIVFTKKKEKNLNNVLKFERNDKRRVKNKSEIGKNFYSVPQVLNITKNFKNHAFLPADTTTPLFKNFRRNLKTEFCFYRNSHSKKTKEWFFWLQQKQQKNLIFAFQKTSLKILPNTKVLKQKWLELTNQIQPFSIRSPLFTKQEKTPYSGSTFFGKKTIKFTPILVTDSIWCSPSQILNVEITMQASASLKKVEKIHPTNEVYLPNSKNNSKNNSKKSSHILIPEWNTFFYTKQLFQDSNRFSFETFQNGWVIPEFPITHAFLKAQTLGEFRGIQNKETQATRNLNDQQTNRNLSFVRDLDCLTLRFSSSLLSQIEIQKTASNCKNNEYSKNLDSQTLVERSGTFLKNRVGLYKRWGQEWGSNFAYPTSGQILKITQNSLTIRKGIPLLASIRGLVHVSNSNFVEKNQLLVTLKSRRLQTEDIVQGIPKIEQLFEARETQGGELIHNNMHMLLHRFFRRASRVRGNREAVQLSLFYIQAFLINNILQAYANQGVFIAEKHVEIVVRQMTARVRIIEGGDTGFLPGELVQHRLLEKLNKVLEHQKCRPAQYEPVILGITKSVLNSESFLLAASFQQVSKVLVQSALAKKTDFLRGLHENLIVGQMIPAGTGIINIPRNKKTPSLPIISETISESSTIPEIDPGSEI